MLRALLFDLNGVVVDDMRHHERAWIDLAASRGRPLDVDEVRTRLSGKRNAEILRELFGEGLSPDELLGLEEAKESAYRRAFSSVLSPVAGLVPLLDACRAAGVATALVTSAPEPNIDFVLDGLSLRQRFDTRVGARDVRRGKPDPEGYLLGAARLGAPPSGCVVFEDALLGLEAGRRAGMTVVGVTTSHPATELAPFCALAIDDFEALSLDAIAALLR
jgi:HAD superfamily hydrolase (TIGR01509 family)